MIVLCEDGFYYKNPTWKSGTLVVKAELGVVAHYRWRSPPEVSTILLAMVRAFHIYASSEAKLVGDRMFFEGKGLVSCMRLDDCKIIKGRPVVPTAHEGRSQELPSWVEDDVVGLAPYRQKLGRNPQEGKVPS